jgi:hypothetical protein
MPLTGPFHNDTACSYATPAPLKFCQVRINGVFDLRTCRHSFKHDLGRRLHDFAPIEMQHCMFRLAGASLMQIKVGHRSRHIALGFFTQTSSTLCPNGINRRSRRRAHQEWITRFAPET